MKKMPPREVLLQLLRYEPETGELFWKERPLELCAGEGACKRLNRLYAGKQALTSIRSTGYYSGSILGHPYPAHRVIWLMMTGTVADEVDHINGNKLDNRWSNLRASSRRSNARNQGLHSRNTTGCSGVRKTRNGKFRATISGDDSRTISLGTFASLEEAVTARRAAQSALGYSEGHGKRRAHAP